MSGGAREWITERVDGLTGSSDRVLEVQPAVVNSFREWLALKLIVLSATVNMYTRVISQHKDDFFYIDALAGAGVSEYGEGQCFLGSPIVAAKAATEPFSKMYFVEDDKRKKEALEERLEFAFSSPEIDIVPPHTWEVYRGDANEVIYDIVDDIWDQSRPAPDFNYFAFIDNQGLDFRWDAMEKIGNLTGDLLINYPAARGVGDNMNNKDSRDALTAFFGRNMWHVEPKTREHYKEMYMRQLDSLGVPEKVPVKIDSGSKSYYYDVIYATRTTRGGSGYTDAVTYAKRFVEDVDGGTVEEILDVLHGDQAAIEDFLPDDTDLDQSLFEDNEVDDPDQTGLDQFG
jgi:three-Cys-motif partner protein